MNAVCCLKHFSPYLCLYCMVLTQIWIGRKPSLRRSIYGVRVRVTRPNSDEIGRLNLAQLKLILNPNDTKKCGFSEGCLRGQLDLRMRQGSRNTTIASPEGVTVSEDLCSIHSWMYRATKKVGTVDSAYISHICPGKN